MPSPGISTRVTTVNKTDVNPHFHQLTLHLGETDNVQMKSKIPSISCKFMEKNKSGKKNNENNRIKIKI